MNNTYADALESESSEDEEVLGAKGSEPELPAMVQSKDPAVRPSG